MVQKEDSEFQGKYQNPINIEIFTFIRIQNICDFTYEQIHSKFHFLNIFRRPGSEGYPGEKGEKGNGGAIGLPGSIGLRGMMSSSSIEL